ncbi:hypothetical protein ACJJTC_009183 [Scirpophaga incertulas]
MNLFLGLNRSLTKWWDDDVLRYLPRPTDEMRKLCSEIIGVQGRVPEMVDTYHDYNRPFEYTVFYDCFEFKMCHTLRDLAPSFSENCSPFVVRGRAIGQNKGPTSKNPVISGRSSTTSNNSSDSNSDSSSDDDITSPSSSRQVTPLAADLTDEQVDIAPAFPPVKRHNRIVICEPSKQDMIMYKRYVNFEKRSNPKYKSDIHVVLTVSSAFTIDSSVDVIPPTVTRASKEIYKDYVQRASGRLTVPPDSLAIYKKYVECNASQ